MTRLVRADITWGALPVRRVDLSSCQTVSQPVQVLDRPVTAGVGEQVGGAGLGAIEAGHIEHGLAPSGLPAAARRSTAPRALSAGRAPGGARAGPMRVRLVR